MPRQNGVVLTLFFLFPFLLRGQIPQCAQKDSSVSIPLDKWGIDVISKQGMSMIPIFEVKNSTIHDYLDIVGADFKSKLDSIRIIPPADALGSLSYGYFFQLHNQNTWEPNRLPFLIENGTFWHRKKYTRIWLDRNHDLNFDNDRPDTFVYGVGKGVFRFIDGYQQSSGVKAQVFPSERFSRFASLNDLSIEEMSNGRRFLGTGNSLKIEKINTIYNHIRLGRDTFALGLMDVNSNGKFGDFALDKWILSKGSDSLMTHELEIPVNGKAYLVWMGNAYKIEWNQTQGLATLIPTIDKIKNAPSLLLGDKLPCFKYCSTNPNQKRESSLKKYQKKQVWVVWSAENNQFMRDSAKLHEICRNTSDAKKWLFLNFGGSGKYVLQYNKRYDLGVNHGFCNSRIAKKLKLQQLPQYFVWDENQRLIWTGSNVLDLEEILLKQELRP